MEEQQNLPPKKQLFGALTTLNIKHLCEIFGMSRNTIIRVFNMMKKDPELMKYFYDVQNNWLRRISVVQLRAFIKIMGIPSEKFPCGLLKSNVYEAYNITPYIFKNWIEVADNIPEELRKSILSQKKIMTSKELQVIHSTLDEPVKAFKTFIGKNQLEAIQKFNEEYQEVLQDI